MNDICSIIKLHNHLLEDDKERLKTDFLLSLILSPKERIKYLKNEANKIRFSPDIKWEALKE